MTRKTTNVRVAADLDRYLEKANLDNADLAEALRTRQGREMVLGAIRHAAGKDVSMPEESDADGMITIEADVLGIVRNRTEGAGTGHPYERIFLEIGHATVKYLWFDASVEVFPEISAGFKIQAKIWAGKLRYRFGIWPVLQGLRPLQEKEQAREFKVSNSRGDVYCSVSFDGRRPIVTMHEQYA